MPMKSNDEDLDLFLAELMVLLNKYHYNISPKFRLGKFTDEESKIVAVQADGSYLWLVAKIDGNFYRIGNAEEESSG